jgi:hypothetical protein
LHSLSENVIPLVNVFPLGNVIPLGNVFLLGNVIPLGNESFILFDRVRLNHVFVLSVLIPLMIILDPIGLLIDQYIICVLRL